MAAPRIEHAFALMTRGDAAQAADLLRELLADAPAYAPGHVLHAQACEALHRWPEALAAWQTVGLLMPALPAAQAGVLRATRVLAALRAMPPRDEASEQASTPEAPTSEAPAPEASAQERDAPPRPTEPDSPSQPEAQPPLQPEAQPPSQLGAQPPPQPTQAYDPGAPRAIRLGGRSASPEPAPPSATPYEAPASPAPPASWAVPSPPATPDDASPSALPGPEPERAPADAPLDPLPADLPELPPPPPPLDLAPDDAPPSPFASRLADAFRTQTFDDVPEPDAPAEARTDASERLPSDLPNPGAHGWDGLSDSGESDAADAEPLPNETRAPESAAFSESGAPGASVPDDLDLDGLIADLNAAGRMTPRPDLDDIPPPRLEDDIDDMISPTMGRIFAVQGNVAEAARVFERLAEQQPERADTIRGEAARLFERLAAEQPDTADDFAFHVARLRALGTDE